MLLTSLLFVAVGQSDVVTVTHRFQLFAKQHPALSVDCAVSGYGGVGKSELILVRGGSAIKVDWTATFPDYTFRFVSDGRFGLEVDHVSHMYDRQWTVQRPVPMGRVRSTFGYPMPVVEGTTPFTGREKLTKFTRQGKVAELELTVRGNDGFTMYTGDFAADGHLTMFDTAKGSPGHWSHERIEFSHYRFAAAARTSSFDVSPPVGYTPFAFDPTVHAIGGTDSVPAVPLTGVKRTTLAALSDKPKLLIAFVGTMMPAGLLHALKRLGAQVPVVTVALNGAKVGVAGLPLYRTNDAGFDRAGVRATPTFYLVSEGKVVQAWCGFRAADAAKFEGEVAKYAASR